MRSIKRWRYIIAVGLLTLISSPGTKESSPVPSCETSSPVKSFYVIPGYHHLDIVTNLPGVTIVWATPRSVDQPRLSFLSSPEESIVIVDTDYAQQYENTLFYLRVAQQRSIYVRIPVQNEKDIPEGQWILSFEKTPELKARLDIHWHGRNRSLDVSKFFTSDTIVTSSGYELCVLKDSYGRIKDVHYRELNYASVTQRDRR